MSAESTPISDVSHGELARRIAEGRDPHAEAEICRRFAPRIRLYGLKHLGDEDHARDLVQAVLVSVIEATRAGRVEDPERLDRFVLGTCRHLSLRARHADGRAQAVDPRVLEQLDLRAVMPDHAGVDVEALLRCFGLLDARAQTVLQLSFYRDKTADEIATVLATSAGNVRVLRHRAVAQLRDCLGEAA